MLLGYRMNSGQPMSLECLRRGAPIQFSPIRSDRSAWPPGIGGRIDPARTVAAELDSAAWGRHPSRTAPCAICPHSNAHGHGPGESRTSPGRGNQTRPDSSDLPLPDPRARGPTNLNAPRSTNHSCCIPLCRWTIPRRIETRIPSLVPHASLCAPRPEGKGPFRASTSGGMAGLQRVPMVTVVGRDGHGRGHGEAAAGAG
jgi:hypothetical protein